MAINYKQQATAEMFAADIKRKTTAVTTTALLVGVSGTAASPTTPGDNVVVVINSGDASTAGSGVVIFKGQRGTTTSTDPGFSDLPGFSGSGKQPVYTTGVVVYITELAAAGDLTPAAGVFVPVLADLSRRGLKIEHWATANATAPNSVNLDTLATATLQATYEPNVDWSISGRV